MSVDLVSSESVTNSSEYAIYADARFGDNGDMWGMGEYSVGTPYDGDVDIMGWDPDLEDGFDSDWVSFRLHLQSDGTVTWAIQGANGPITFSATPISSITSIEITAGVQIEGASFAFRSLTVEFFDDGEATDQIIISNSQAASVDTSQSMSIQQATTIVTPTNSGNDEVIISGALRLTAEAGAYPWGCDMFGRILIMA